MNQYNNPFIVLLLHFNERDLKENAARRARGAVFVGQVKPEVAVRIAVEILGYGDVNLANEI